MPTHYDKHTLIQILQDKANKLGRVPTPADMDTPSAKVYLSYFKKWDKAIKAAKIQVASMPAKATDTEVSTNKEEKTQIQQDEILVTSSTSRRKYSKTMIKKMLLDEVRRLGKRPTRKEIDANKNLPTVATCLNYFNTTKVDDLWKEVLGE